MMSETVVTVQDGAGNNASGNPRQVPTVKTEPGQPGIFSAIKINIPYFKTIPGMVKIAELALGILCMACASPAHTGATSWFLTVATIAFIMTLLWCIVYFFSIREALKLPINWILSELLNTSIFAVLYLTAFIAQLSVWSAVYPGSSLRASNIAAGVFGIFNTIAYAAGSYFLYIEWKNSNAQ